MIITEIVVSAGRTFNHPHEQYSNLRPEVTLKATLAEGEDAEAAARSLQQTAEKLVEDHKANMLRALEELEQLREAQKRISSLGESIGRQQDELERMRQQWPNLPWWLQHEPETSQ